MIRVYGPQAGEADIEGLERLEQLLGELVFAGYLVVDELEPAKTGDVDYLLDLFDDIANRTRPVAPAVENRDFAERATVGASAAGLHRNRLEQIAVEFEQLVARTRQVLEVVQLIGAISLLH